MFVFSRGRAYLTISLSGRTAEVMHLNFTHQINVTAINVNTSAVAAAGAAVLKSLFFIKPLKDLECRDPLPSHTHAYYLWIRRKVLCCFKDPVWRAHIPNCNASLISAKHKEPACKSPVDKLKDCNMLVPSCSFAATVLIKFTLFASSLFFRKNVRVRATYVECFKTRHPKLFV